MLAELLTSITTCGSRSGLCSASPSPPAANSSPSTVRLALAPAPDAAAPPPLGAVDRRAPCSSTNTDMPMCHSGLAVVTYSSVAAGSYQQRTASVQQVVHTWSGHCCCSSGLRCCCAWPGSWAACDGLQHASIPIGNTRMLSDSKALVWLCMMAPRHPLAVTPSF
jgi:hypothetical protein